MNQQNSTSTRNTADRLERFAIFLGLLVVALQGIRTISHAEFWTHLATGRWITLNGIPRVDPLSVVSEGAAWIHSSWLYDLLLFRLWQVGGGAGFGTVIHVVVVLAAFILLIRVVRPQSSPLAIGAGLLLSAWLLAPRFEVRSSIFALVFPALYIHVLSPKRLPWTPFAVLVPAQILWTNIDVSFIWGPILALLFTAQAYFQPNDPPRRHAETIRLGGLAVAVLLASLVNPYGPAIFADVAATWTSPVLRDWISPISAHFDSKLARHMVTLSLIVGAAGLLTRRDRLPVGLTAIAVISAFLVVHSTPAHVTLFALFAFPFFCLSFQSLGEFVRDRLSEPSLPARTALLGLFGLLALVSVLAVMTNRYYVRTGNFSGFGLGALSQPYPDAAQSIIQRPDFPDRFLNLPTDGGYLAWRNPSDRVFIDQRSDLHAQDAYNLLAQGLVGRDDAWSALLTKWDPEAIILNNTWPYTAEIIRHIRSMPDWETIYFDGITTIFVLGTSANASILSEKESFLEAGLKQLEQERRSYQRKLRMLVQAPVSAPLVGAAAVFQARGYYREAAACHELLTIGAPHMVSAQLNLGICQTRLQRYEEAVDTLSASISKLRRETHPWVVAHLNMGIAQTEMAQFAQAIRYLRIVVEANTDNVLGWLWLSRAYSGAGQVADAQQALEQARAINPETAQAFQERR